ncbi:MAG: hypothetical protein HC906_11560 [Bacteroidales bacterium]|nr:hypothetical protein [Bacteroidales bacterium]
MVKFTIKVFLTAILVLFNLFLSIVYSQETGIKFHNFKTEIQGQVTCIMQDHKGYLWIGTMYGIYRYDGKTIKSFTNHGGYSLPSNTIWNILEDQNGYLWIRDPRMALPDLTG